MSTAQHEPESETKQEPVAGSGGPPGRRGPVRLILATLLIGIPVVVFIVQGLSRQEQDQTAPSSQTTGERRGAQANRNRQADTQYLLAVQAIRKNEFATAVLHLERAVELNPEHPLAHADLGSALVKQGRLEEAVKHFREDLRINPRKAATHYNLGVALSQMNKLAEAIQEYRLALQEDPNLVGAQCNLGTALKMLGRIDESAEAYQRTIALASESQESAERDGVLLRAYTGLAEVMIRRGEWDAAAGYASTALQIDPNSADVHYSLGEIAAIQNRPQEAREHFRKVLELNPEDTRAKTQLDLLSGSATSDGGEQFTQAGGADAPGASSQGDGPPPTQTVSEDPASAVERLEKALEATPDDINVLNELGVALARAGRLADAKSRLVRAIQLDPERYEPHINLAGVLVALGELDYAEQEYRLGILYGGGNPFTYRSLLRLQYDRGESQKAVNTARQGINDIGEDPGLMLELIWLLATCPDDSVRGGEEAVTRAEHLKQVWETRGSPPVQGVLILDALAAAYAEAGRFDDAVTTAQQAIAMATSVPNHPPTTGLKERLEQYQQGQPWRAGRSPTQDGPPDTE